MKYSHLIFSLIAVLFCGLSSAQELAADFAGEDLNGGGSIRLSEHRGKVVFLDFWASWCPPCLLSLPAYDQMLQQIDSPDFTIIAINVDEDTDNGLDFLIDTPVSYPVIADPAGDIGIPYGIRSLPVSFLINRQGQIVKRYRSFQPGDEDSIQGDIEELLGLERE